MEGGTVETPPKAIESRAIWLIITDFPVISQIMLHSYVITVKYPRNPDHNPRDKKTGLCPHSSECSDSTGAHHSFIVMAYSMSHAVLIVDKHYPKIHITRIEYGEMIT